MGGAASNASAAKTIATKSGETIGEMRKNLKGSRVIWDTVRAGEGAGVIAVTPTGEVSQDLAFRSIRFRCQEELNSLCRTNRRKGQSESSVRAGHCAICCAPTRKSSARIDG